MYQLSRTFELRTVHIQCKAEFTMPRKVLCMTCLESWARLLKAELRYPRISAIEKLSWEMPSEGQLFYVL